MRLATTTAAGRAARIQERNGEGKHNYYISIDIMGIASSEVNSQFS